MAAVWIVLASAPMTDVSVRSDPVALPGTLSASAEGQQRLLQLVAAGHPLPELLHALARFAEQQAAPALCSVLLVDPDARRLRHGAAPSLPDAYSASVDGTPIGPAAGSCGTAAHRREPVIVTDIATDPLWAAYRHLALPHGLRACWSVPVVAGDGAVLGTFAMYYRESRAPSPDDLRLMVLATDLARIAIERERTTSALRRADESLRRQALVFETMRDGVIVMAPDGTIVDWNPGAERIYGYTRAEMLGRPPVMLHDPAVDERLDAAIREALGRDGRWEGEIPIRRKDGSRGLVDTTIVLQRDEHGAPVGFVAIDRDVTERRRDDLAVRESERLLREAEQVAQIGSWEWEIATDTITWSDSLCRLYGRPPGAPPLTFEAYLELVHPADRQLAREEAERAFRTRRPFAFDHRVVRSDGTIRYHHGRGEVVLDAHGTPVRMVGSSQDITDRKLAEEALREREEHLAAVIRIQQEIATASLDLSSVLALVLDGAVTLTGAGGASVAMIEGEELVCRAALGTAAGHEGIAGPASAGLSGACVDRRETLYAEDVELDPLADRELCRATRTRSLVCVPLLHEGEVVGVLRAGAPEPGHFGALDVRTLELLAGQVGAAIGRSRDAWAKQQLIAQRTEALAALAQSEAHFRSLIENASDPVLILDADLRARYTSPAITPVLGYRPGDLGRPVLSIVHPEDLPRAMEALGRLLAHPEERVSVELRVQHTNGSWRTLVVAARNLLEEPAVGGIVANVRDVTEKHALAEQLRQSHKLEAIGRLAGGVAHDFNNLLTVIKAHSEFLTADLDAVDPRREDVGEIRKAAERAAALTRQLLAFSRQQILQPRVLDLDAVVANIAPMLRRLIGEDIEVVVSGSAEDARVLADPGQIEQVLMNLAVNARDAMPRGGRLAISTKLVELDDAYADRHDVVEPGPYVMLAVSDTGVGIDPAVRAHIFEPFFTTKQPGEGTGLGLATVYGIVKQSGGYIWVYSEPGQGTTFKVYLPRVNASPVGERAAAPVAPPRGTETILLVEDEEAVRRLASRVLRRQGYTVIEAAHGIEALARADEYGDAIDLVLTDVIMPRMSGRELVERLAVRFPRIRILYMSGYTDDDIIRRGAVDTGSRSLLQKPFTIEGLALAVRAALDGG